MDKLPKNVLVPILIILSVVIIVVSQRPHSTCDSQVEVFVEAQRGYLFAKSEKGKRKRGQYQHFLTTCREGATAGSCHELFVLMKKTVRDLEAAPLECSTEFAEVEELKRAVSDSIEILAIVAWGAEPPPAGSSHYSWLEPPDLALFCQLKRNFLKIYGEEAFEELRSRVNSVLPGEPLVLGPDGKCKNCEGESRRRRATEVLSSNEIWSKSIFSLRCDQYQ